MKIVSIVGNTHLMPKVSSQSKLISRLSNGLAGCHLLFQALPIARQHTAHLSNDPKISPLGLLAKGEVKPTT